MTKGDREYQICTRCIMDTSVPGIQFDHDGVCSQCTSAIKTLETRWIRGAKGEETLNTWKARMQEYGRNRDYDCIIGVSGGVDSSYLLHVAKVELGLRPLAVHVDAGWNSETAVQNIESMVKALDIELFTYVVDWEEMRDLQLAYLKASVANQDVPQDHAYFAKLYEFAIKNNIRYVLVGSNFSSESILPDGWGYTSSDSKQIKAIHKKFGSKPLKTFPLMSIFEYLFYWPMVRRMVQFAPLNYMDYDKEAAIRFLETNYGWQYYGGKHFESRWTKYFQSYYLPTKFGYDKRRAHLSSLIIANQTDRATAMEEMSKPVYNPNTLQEDEEFVARKLGIGVEALHGLHALPNATYEDYPNQRQTIDQLRKIKTLLFKRGRN